MSGHTKERLAVFAAGKLTQIDIGKPTGKRPCAVAWGGFDGNDLSLVTNRANAARFVACWNAMRGLDPAALPALIEAAKGVVEHFDGTRRDKDWPETERVLRTALANLQGDAALTDGEVGNG